MITGSCFCGKVRVKYSGQPVTVALCHCSDCRKLTGCLYTYNLLVKKTDLNVTGVPKEIAKTSDSGSPYKNYFCQDCGTPLYGMKINSDGSQDDIIVLRAGIFDDIEVLNQHKPEVEIYTDGRVKRINPTEGAGQFGGMPPQT